MALVWLLLTMALADGPVCEEGFEVPPDVFSVAWITPARRGARAGTWMEVVRTSDLRDWLREHPEADLGRALQHLGLRKRDTKPRRLYKVTLFEARAADLCRPIRMGEGAPPFLDGVLLCHGHTRRHSRCGYSVDRADGSRGLDVYRIQWKTAAVRGFCVLPAERFLQEGRQP